MDDRLVFAKGYGYRDYEKKLPVTPQTLFPIASNTNLFTAVAAGFLVEDGLHAQPLSPLRGSVIFMRPVSHGWRRGLYSVTASGGCLDADASAAYRV